MTTQSSRIEYPRYHSLLTSKGFTFSHSQQGHGIGGAREDVYLHQACRFKTYIGPMEARGPVVLHTGIGNAKRFDVAHKHSDTVTNEDNGRVSYVWHTNTINALMESL